LHTACDGGKGQVLCGAMAPLAPQVEEAAVTESDVLNGIDAEADGGAVDPLGCAFELGIVADGGFVDDAVAFTVGPLGAPLFVTEGGNQTERKKELLECVAVGDAGFGFDAMLVAVLGGDAGGGEPLIREGPAARVVADAEDFGTRAQLAIGRVVEYVAFEAARSLQAKAGGLEPLRKYGRIGEAEFDLGFDGHRYMRV